MKGRKTLPIGNDDFRKLRKNNSYYVDKTRMIKDFIEMHDEVALIARPRRFWENFELLVSGQEVPVWLTLETSYVERDSNYSLWRLLVNSGYLTTLRRVDANTAIIKIPNDEVMSEFQMLIAEISGIDGLDLQQMLSSLLDRNMKCYNGNTVSGRG